jgi:hypothetical protein
LVTRWIRCLRCATRRFYRPPLLSHVPELSPSTEAGRARPAREPSLFDACQIGVVLRTVVFVEVVVAIAALFVVSTPGEWLVQTATVTGGALPATLLWLVTACGLKKPLRPPAASSGSTRPAPCWARWRRSMAAACCA